MNQPKKKVAYNAPAQTAILFDAENISCQLAETAIQLSIPYGKPILRAYADFSKPHTKGWEKPALKHGIRTIHQFSYDNKNSSSDFLLMHDAFKLVYSGKIETFVIVTNDSDFVTPIQLLRQSGAYVHGIGIEGKCSSLLPESCNSFDFMDEKKGTAEAKQRETAKVAKTKQQPDVSKQQIVQLCQAYQHTSKCDQGWASVSELSKEAMAVSNTYKKFSSLLKHSEIFELTDRNRKVRLIESFTEAAQE